MTGVDEVSGVAYYGAVAGFTKLFSTIVDSTVWREEMHVKVVWITMLAKANRNGDVLASVPGLADAARVSLDQCVEALARLSAPDTWSRTKEHEGRRIVEVDGGWRLLNYPKYRELRDADERRIQTREAVRRYRAKEKANPITVSTGKHGKPRKAQAEAEAEAEIETTTTHVEPSGSTSVVKRATVGEIQAHLAQVLADVQAGTQRRLRATEVLELKAEMAFTYWAARLSHNGTRLDKKRLHRLMARLRENDGDIDELLYVVDGALCDLYLMGQNQSGTKYDGIETIFRDRGQVERLAMLAHYTPGKQHKMVAELATLFGGSHDVGSH